MGALLTFLITQAPGLIALGQRLINEGRDKATAEELADAGIADDHFIRAYLRLYLAAPAGAPAPAPVVPAVPAAVVVPPLVPRATGYIKPRLQ